MRGAEHEQGDLAGGEDAERWAPEAGAAAGVEEGAGAVVGEIAARAGWSRRTRWWKGQIWPPWVWPESWRSMPAGRRPVDELGLVGEEQDGEFGVGAVQGSGEVGAVARQAGGLGGDVVDAG